MEVQSFLNESASNSNFLDNLIIFFKKNEKALYSKLYKKSMGYAGTGEQLEHHILESGGNLLCNPR
jgi:hypothetical protein